MGTSNSNRGGKRVGAGRKESEATKVMRVPVSLVDEVNKLIEVHNIKAKALKQPVKHYDCDCAVIGYTVGGKEIVRVCKLHR